MWVTTGGTGKARVALYQYSRTRSSAFVKDFLATYHGYLQTDGYGIPSLEWGILPWTASLRRGEGTHAGMKNS
jgi:hypothetical protein